MPILKEHPVKALPFTEQRGFRKTLNERVAAYLQQHNLPARDVPAMYVKTVIVLAWWLIAYLAIMLAGIAEYLCYYIYRGKFSEELSEIGSQILDILFNGILRSTKKEKNQ